MTAHVAPLLELRNVHASYGRIQVLHGIDLVVPRGQVVALLGPNGAGKTTTLLVATGQHPASAGCVHVGGRHVNGVNPDELARQMIRQHLAFPPGGRGWSVIGHGHTLRPRADAPLTLR